MKEKWAAKACMAAFVRRVQTVRFEGSSSQQRRQAVLIESLVVLHEAIEEMLGVPELKDNESSELQEESKNGKRRSESC